MGKDKKTLLNRIRENRFILRAMTVFGLAAGTYHGGESDMGVTKISAHNLALKTADFPLNKTVLKSMLNEVDIKAEARKRTDWLMAKASDSLKLQLETLIHKNPRQHKQMVKKITNTVQPGCYHDQINYCLAAIMYNFKKLNNHVKDFDAVLPADSTHTGLWCRGFVAAMQKQFPGRVIRTNDLSKELKQRDDKTGAPRIRPGAVILVANGSNLHAVYYESLSDKGEPQVISYNRDGRGKLRGYGKKGFIVDVAGIVQDRIISRLEKDLDNNKIAWLNEVYQGRDIEMVDLVSNSDRGKRSLQPTPQMFSKLSSQKRTQR